MIKIGAMIQVANETVAGRIIVDGVTIPIDAAAFVFGTSYEAMDTDAWYSDFLWRPAAQGETRSFFMRGQNIAVDIRKTTANGVGNLQCRVKWARLLPT
jgi:hypothetical protein